MNRAQDACGEPPASWVAEAGISPCSDNALIASLLIGVNLLVFALVQSGNLRFEKGDFKMFYTAAIALRSGQNIYNPDGYAAIQRNIVPSLPLVDVKPYTHPPYELLVVLPFSFLRYEAACWCWTLLALLLGVACGRLLGSYCAVLGMFPFLIVLWEQQDSTFALLILIACWFAVRNGRDVLAGLILGLALFKFQIIVPLALALAFWRPRLLKGFAISGSTVFALCLALVRPTGMIAYWHYLVGMTGASYTSISAYHMDPRHNVALRGIIYALVGPHAYVVSVLTGIIGLLILRVVWRLMKNPEPSWEVKFAAAVIAALLLSFHLLAHDLILLALPFVLLASSVARWPLAALYAVPILFVPHASAWLAVVPISSLAVMMVVYSDRPPILMRHSLAKTKCHPTAIARGAACD